MYLKFLAKRAYLQLKSSLQPNVKAALRNADTYPYKWSRLQQLVNRYGCDTIVETGTYYGLTVGKLRKDVASFISIEIDNRLYACNAKFFRRAPNVQLIKGDSSEVLVRILDELKPQGDNHRMVFWLDGHCSEKETGKGEKYSPLEEELLTINRNYEKLKAVVVIDDMRLFDGKDYPTLNQLVSLMPEERYTHYVDSDALVFIDKRLAA